MSRGMHFGPLVLWFVTAVAVAVAGARISVWVQPHFAPVVIYPVLVGAVVGVAFAGLAVLAGVERSRGILIAVVLLAVAASLLEHAFFYRDYRASFVQARERGEERIGFPLPEVEPVTFGEYLRSHAEASGREIGLWVANPLITAAAAGVVFWYMSGKAGRRQA
jgi:hypothetical protein